MHTHSVHAVMHAAHDATRPPNAELGAATSRTSRPAEAAPGPITPRRCNVYVHQPSSADKLTDSGWREDQYAVHWWVQRALQSHPWRVQSSAEADVIYFNSSLTYSNRFPRNQNPLGSAATELTHQVDLMYPKANDSTLRRCGAVWFATSFNQRSGKHTKIRPSPCLRFVREVMWGIGEFGLPLVAPFVVASPSWLTTSDTSAARQKLVPWAERKLLFFAGHMPQLHINNVRWNLWRDLQGDPRATLISPDVINLARYARVCDNFLRGRGFIGNTTFSLRGISAGLLPPLRDVYDFMMADCVALCKAHGEKFTVEGCGDSKLSPEQACANDRNMIQRIIRENSTQAVFSKCRILAAHEVPAVVRKARGQLDPVRLSHELYLEEMMRHKFCVVAAGDDMSTRKIGETMAVASRGGCLPLIVGNHNNSGQPIPHFAYLPHTESIDYCRVGFIVPLMIGRRVPAFKQMLAALEGVTTNEWRERHHAAKQLRSWFVYREGSTKGDASSASDHIISRMCQMAAQLRRTLPTAVLSRGYDNKTTARQATPQMCPPHSEALAEWQRSSAKHMRLCDAWFRGRAAPE